MLTTSHIRPVGLMAFVNLLLELAVLSKLWAYSLVDLISGLACPAEEVKNRAPLKRMPTPLILFKFSL